MKKLSKDKIFEDRHKSCGYLKTKFQFTDVVGSLEIQEDSNAFKKLKFEATGDLKLKPYNEEAFDLSEILSDSSMSIDESIEEHTKKLPKQADFNMKSRFPQSPYSRKLNKDSVFDSLFSKPQEEMEIERQMSTKITLYNEEKAEKENIPSQSKEYLDFLPAKKYCKYCNCKVNTTIKLEMPTVSL